MIGRIAALLMGFVARVVFTHTLSMDYVGVNGLFTDILNVLSLTELGVGTAITYALYKPIADEDIEKQKSLINLYRTIYRFVAAAVLVLGLALLPFMDVLIKNPPEVEGLTVIYLMYLANSVISYLLIYRKTLLDAAQLSYIGVLCQTGTWIIQIIIQIAVLVLTHNFILYLSLMLLGTLVSNVLISCFAVRRFPFLRDKTMVPLAREEKRSIASDVGAMMVHKLGDVAVNNTDNLLLSAIVGIGAAGMYSNYYLIIESIKGVLIQIFQGITASVGNLGVSAPKERVHKIYYACFFIGQWVYGFAAICLFELLDVFVGLSFGSNYVFERNITLMLCINLYIAGMRQSTLTFRESLGLFKYDKLKSVFAAVINLVTSIILGRMYGTLGIFAGTAISTILTGFWVEPYILHKRFLKRSCAPYFLKYLLYTSVTAVLWYGTDFLCSKIVGSPVRILVLRLLVITGIVNGVYLILYSRTKEFNLLKYKLSYILGKKKGRIRNISNNDRNFLLMVGDTLKSGKSEVTGAPGIYRLVEEHSLAPLFYDCRENFDERTRAKIESEASSAVLRYHKLLYITKITCDLLSSAGIECLVLKGVSLSYRYPVPEYRTFGDVDLLLRDPKDIDTVTEILKNYGYRAIVGSDSNHHREFIYRGIVDVEIHTEITEDFDNRRINAVIRKVSYWKNSRDFTLMGADLKELPPAEYAYSLMVHMLQHFLMKGFGVRLLCDWIVFLRSGIDEAECKKYLEYVNESKIKGFSDAVNICCVKYMGLEQDIADQVLGKNCLTFEETALEEFMAEILEAGPFGKNDPARMVMLREPTLKGLFNEFNHQVRLNFPRMSNVFIAWPVLMILTVSRFHRNNKTVRAGISGLKILRRAKERSNILQTLMLWK